MKRVSLYDNDKKIICGIPLDLVIKDNLVCVINENNLYYYPSEESIHD